MCVSTDTGDPSPNTERYQHCNLKAKSSDKEDGVENQIKEGRLKQEERKKGKPEKHFS